ncbi:leucine-rich repeat receptor-like serine/threonine-protein kinase [Corchorus olitorius]|uniref:Leucine-rich repeat receptor-like serine/threonine-protein kinase n=1 Tax=Corchorus olitorius TaxID=93759 RepID=A0A1R3JRB6_9ROSI|nr:leucine-rich repeat receptor-like serine/threonine-protein kinase [Corchorus olitorius]
MDVVDLSMISEEEMGELSIKGRPQISAASMVEEFIVPVMKIGLLCSATSPSERMIMSLVVNKLIDIKQSFLKLRSDNKRRIRRH